MQQTSKPPFQLGERNGDVSTAIKNTGNNVVDESCQVAKILASPNPTPEACPMYRTLCAAVLLLPMSAFAQDGKPADAAKATTPSSPTIVASIKLTNQTAESGPITLVTPSANTLYRITGYMEVGQCEGCLSRYRMGIAA